MLKQNKLPKDFTGEYSYAGNTALPAVPFTLSLAQSICGGFHGSITEDPALGIRYPAKIRGRVKRQSMAFRKDYAGAPFLVQGDAGSESLDDYVAKRYQLRLLVPFPHPSIFYFGKIEEGGQRIAGCWTMQPEIVPLSDGHIMPFPRNRGFFRLHAVKA